jgi:hypothetical protein
MQFEEPSTVPVGQQLRQLLELDRSLSPTERKVLEVLLLRPPATTARDLSRATATNLQALYTALDRLAERGLVTSEKSGASTRFRVAHPSVVLHALVEPGVRAATLAQELEAPLRTFYERDDQDGFEEPGREARATRSMTAASSWLMDLVASAGSEIWFLGDEAPWFAASSALEGELAKRRGSSVPVQIRFLSSAEPNGRGSARSDRHLRLQRAGAELRRSPRFRSPTVVIDQRWMIVESESAKGGRTVYLRLEAPNLCRDLIAVAETAWREADVPAGRAVALGRPAAPIPTGT